MEFDTDVKQKIWSAVQGVARRDFSAAIKPTDVAKCRDLSPPDGQKRKTNPTTIGAEPRGLSPRQRAAAKLLVAGRSVRQAAGELGIDPRTIFRWKKQPLFNAAVDQALLKVAEPPAKPTARPRTVLGRMDSGFSQLVAPRSSASLLSRENELDADLDSDAPVPPGPERDRMEKMMASFGYIPTWRRNQPAPTERREGQTKPADAPVALCREMSRNVSGERSKMKNEPNF